MKEKIILAPGLNGNELMRSLALHGKNCIGTRILGAAELARLALMRSGIPITGDFVSAKEEAGIIAEAAAEETYFGKASYSDIQEITSAIRRMRSLIASEDEEKELRRILSKGIFRKKNDALLHVFQVYKDILTRCNAVDAVSLIRTAAFKSKVINSEFLRLKEYPLSPLESVLLDRISGGTAAETELCELFGVTEGKVRIGSIRNCYGAPNEVESILEEIYKGKQLDQCTVAVTGGAAYSQLFFDYALLYDIPVTFGCGIPIINSDPARLLSLYDKWIAGGFFGAESLYEMLSSKAFDRAKLFDRFPAREEGFSRRAFFDILGSLRLTNDRETNRSRIEDFRKAASAEGSGDRKLSYIPCLEILAEELSLPAEDFISRYANIRKGSGTNADRLVMMLDIAAARAIYEELKVIRSAGAARDADDMIPSVLKLNVCAQRSEPGRLHVTGIEGALAAVRKDLYIAGLSASNFPGSPGENYLLLDEDLDLFGPGAEKLTADGRILRKREELEALVRLASALGSEVSLSYAGLNVSELKKDNPSSLIFELFREEHGSAATSGALKRAVRKVDYFEPAISVSRLVGSAYVKGQSIRPEVPANAKEAPVPWGLKKAWSPTELEAYLICPGKFMLKHILGIPEPEEQDPFEIISPADSGTLAHSLMEELGRGSMDAGAFGKRAEERFDRFLKEHPPLIPANVPAVREDFLEMMRTAYEMDPHREVVLEEEEICCTHESGVKIHGFPDRVEKLDDGTFLIVDFKSGGRIRHIKDDFPTCLQVIIYASLAEQKGFRISGAEYRYIRLGETVTCRIDDDMKRQLSEFLTRFRNGMQSGDFPAEPSGEREDPCGYCKYKAVCGKSSDPADAEEGGT